MKLPKKIQVGPYLFRIVRDTDSMKKRQLKRGETLYGESSLDKQRIWIRPGMSADCEADTVLHELLHMCSAVAGGIHDDNEEAFIRRVSPVLLQTLRDNPGLAGYLLDLDIDWDSE